MDKVDRARRCEGEDTLSGADELAQSRLRCVVESVLFAAGEPVGLARLTQIAAKAGYEDPKSQVRRVLDLLERQYVAQGAGIRLVQVAAGYQLRTPPEMAPYVKLILEAKPWRLTRATLETLAIIAYRQPVTRADIEAIRGVEADGVLGSLISRRLVRVVGRREGPGRPLLYGTTRKFLEVFGLEDLRSLPKLGEIGGPEPGESELAGEPISVGGSERARESAGEAPEDTEPGRVVLEAEGGGSDQARQGSDKWPSDNEARHQGRS